VLAVFQFDAVSVPRIEALLAEGKLPTLAQLRERGRWFDLDSPATHLPAGAYATLYSGMHVPDHGQYYAFQWSPPHQRLRWRGEFPQPVMVWERLAKAGKRSLVIDPYECLPPETLDGVALAGYQLVNTMSLPRWTAPAAEARTIDRLFGRPRSVNEVFGQPTPASLLDLRRRLLAATERVPDLARYYLRRDSYDLVWVNLLSGHLGGHMFWDMSNLDGRSLDDETRALFESTLEEIYIRMDHAFGEILAELPGADVLVCAPMGMGVNMSRVDLLPGMLDAVLSGNGGPHEHSRSERFLWNLRARVPLKVRAAVAATLHTSATRELTMRLSSLGVDWSETPIFMLPSDHFAQLRLNVRGRERDGVLSREEADELVDRVREGLVSFREPDGTQTVAAVERTRDVMPDGPFMDMLPDVVVRWSDTPSNGIEHVSSPQHGIVTRPGRGSGRSGAHTVRGWMLVAPETVTPAPHDHPELVDIAATVCAVLGVDTHGLRGRPLVDA
jgi:predicted AlkP superfamily phosphohydrolase/phosphomutase